LKEKGADESDFLIGCHPGGHFSSQRWPIDNFSRLADEIIERYNAKIIIIGNHAEKKLIGKMKQLMKGQGLEFIGLPLDKVTALISLFGLFIANNSGPLHIACALNIPTVSTMGPTDPFLWWPQGENHIVLRNEMDCSPCSKPVCTKHACMRSISVEEMMAAVDSQIKRIKHG
jgi:ADP-heptose:LPS heptosyltransferase